jgi:hypothetical protein
MSNVYWKKSSYSNVNGACVELSATLDAVRDSKDPTGPILRVDARRLVRAVKSGRFDR